MLRGSVSDFSNGPLQDLSNGPLNQGVSTFSPSQKPQDQAHGFAFPVVPPRITIWAQFIQEEMAFALTVPKHTPALISDLCKVAALPHRLVEHERVQQVARVAGAEVVVVIKLCDSRSNLANLIPLEPAFRLQQVPASDVFLYFLRVWYRSVLVRGRMAIDRSSPPHTAAATPPTSGSIVRKCPELAL